MSSSLTVGLVLTSARDMSLCRRNGPKLINEIRQSVRRIDKWAMTHHCDGRLVQFVAWDLHPGHFDCAWVSRRTGGQQVVDDHVLVDRRWAPHFLQKRNNSMNNILNAERNASYFEMRGGLDLADGHHERIADHD